MLLSENNIKTIRLGPFFNLKKSLFFQVVFKKCNASFTVEQYFFYKVYDIFLYGEKLQLIKNKKILDIRFFGLNWVSKALNPKTGPPINRLIGHLQRSWSLFEKDQWSQDYESKNRILF